MNLSEIFAGYTVVAPDHLKLRNPYKSVSSDGSVSFSGSVEDHFNFVNHPSVTVDKDKKLIKFGCDCRDSLKKNTVCGHCALLYDMICSGDVREESCPTAKKIASPAAASPEAAKVDTSVPDEVPAEPEVPFAPPGIQVRLGDRIDTGEPVYWLPNDTEQLFHTNTGIIGTMGTGKTQLTKSLVLQLVRNSTLNYGAKGLGVVIFDYKGDYNENKPDFVNSTGARVYKPYRLPFNPLALINPVSFKPLLPIHTANTFKDTISRIYRLGPKQQQLLLDCIVDAYKKQGIFKETPSTWSRTAPTFDQVKKLYDERWDERHPDSLTAAINKIHDFSIFETDPKKTTSVRELLSGVTVFDLSGYDEDIQSLIVAIMLDLIYAHMMTLGSGATDGRYRQFRQLILVDEADNFMSCGFPSLKKLMKEGREFGVGTVLSTQSLTHFIGDDDDYSRYILTWVVHAASDLKQRDVEYVFKLPPKSAEIDKTYALIKGLEKHRSAVRISTGPINVIRDLAFWQIVNEETNS